MGPELSLRDALPRVPESGVLINFRLAVALAGRFSPCGQTGLGLDRAASGEGLVSSAELERCPVSSPPAEAEAAFPRPRPLSVGPQLRTACLVCAVGEQARSGGHLLSTLVVHTPLHHQHLISLGKNYLEETG